MSTKGFKFPEKQKAVELLLNQFDKSDIFLAPMAFVNDFAFRRLCREKGGIKLCWTGFIMAHVWVNEKNEKKRKEIFQTDGKEKNLVIQILGADEGELIQTAKEVEQYCDMIDLNLGCTHCFASKSECGCYMVENRKRRQKTIEIINHLANSLRKPLSVKMRAIPDSDGITSIPETIEFVKQLEENGVNLITIHGRKMSNDKSGEIDYQLISSIVNAVNIPVIANGAVSSKEEALHLIEKTGAMHVMAAQCFVSNPMHLMSPNLSPSEIALEYIKYAQETNETINQTKKHMYNFFSKLLKENPSKAQEIKSSFTFDALIKFCEENQ